MVLSFLQEDGTLNDLPTWDWASNAAWYQETFGLLDA